MGRVETRRYHRRAKRARTLRRMLLVLLAAAGAVLNWRGNRGGFVAEMLARPTVTPVTADFDRTNESRDVTLAAETWYAIQTGIFSTREAAEQKAEAYTARGAPGVVVQEGEKWRVFIACYGTEAKASAVRERLEERQGVETYLYAWQCPELRLRLGGMAGQLDAVEAGFTLLTSTASALRDMAINLDAGQITMADAISQVSHLDGQITLWEKTVRSRFGKSLPPLVEGMLNVLNNWPERCAAWQKAADATALSAALKSDAMRMRGEIIAWRKGVAGK